MGEARILLRSDAIVTGDRAEVERELSLPELLWNDGSVRKAAIIIFLAAVWEAYGTFLDNPLLFPTFHDTSWCSGCRRGRAGSAGSSSRTATCWIFLPCSPGC